MLLRFKSLHLSRFLSVVVFLATALLVSGCMSSAGDGGGDSSSNDTNSAPGGTTGDNTGGGTGSGTGGTGSGTGGDTSGGTGGSSGGSTGGTGGDTGGGTGGSTGGDTGTVYGTLSSLYINSDNNPSLDIVSCSNPSSGSITFSSVVLRVIGQNGNYVDGVITLTPDSGFATEFDQIFINMSGQFYPDGSFTGTISNMIYSLNGNIVAQAIGSITINVFGTSISIEFTADMNTPACGLAGGFFMSETTDPGTGGGTGGSTGGGGTGGGTGGTGGSATGSTGTDGSLVQATGEFGILTFDSAAHPEDSGSYQLTSATLITHVTHEIFVWTNAEQTTINVYFGFGDAQHINGYMTFNSTNNNSYLCLCFPTIDLINYEASFNNLVLTDTRDSTATISINGVLAFPVLN